MTTKKQAVGASMFAPPTACILAKQADSLIDIPPPPPAPGTTNYLLTGEDTLDYKVHIIGISLNYLFP